MSLMKATKISFCNRLDADLLQREQDRRHCCDLQSFDLHQRRR
jgi:hypothetical protein